MSEFDALLASVKDKTQDRETRLGDFQSLTQIADKQLVSVLNDIVLDKNETRGLRIRAVQYLGRLGDVTSLPALVSFDNEAVGIPLPLAVEARREIAFALSAIYQREFPPQKAAGMKAAATAYAINKLGSDFPRPDVITSLESDYFPG